MNEAAVVQERTPRAKTRPISSVAAEEALMRLLHRSAQDDYTGWDPFDALTSPFLRLSCRTPLLRQAAIQALKRSPVNVRPVLAIRRRSHTKALALFAATYARLASFDPLFERTARALAQQLMDRAHTLEDGLGWAYEFDVQTRWGFYRAGEPNAVATAFAAHALLDVAVTCGAPEFASPVQQALEFACSSLMRPGGFFAYTRESTVPIHNASMLVSSVGARAAAPGSSVRSACRRALVYTLERQRPDGCWPYGEADELCWVDGLHTGYVLQACALWLSAPDHPGVADVTLRGVRAYAEHLIDPDGGPRASVRSRYPLETHAAATAISTFVAVARVWPAYLEVAERVLAWSLPRLQRRDGRFVFRVHRHWTNRIAYVRWSDAHMALALADLVSWARNGR